MLEAVRRKPLGQRAREIEDELEDIDEIKENQKEDRKDIEDLKVRVAILEDHEKQREGN